MRTKRLLVLLPFLTVIVLSVTVSFSFRQANSNGGKIQVEIQDIQVEIQRLTQDWFTAFSKGDGAAMDQMEVPNLVLVNARGTGDIWQKKTTCWQTISNHGDLHRRTVRSPSVQKYSHSHGAGYT